MPDAASGQKRTDATDPEIAISGIFGYALFKTGLEIEMILQKLSEAIRKHDWNSVSIEFLIVVVGIFVGLQVDDWNQIRKDRALEQEYLIRLQADMQWNIDNFHQLEKIFESKAVFINSLRESPATDSPIVGSDEFTQGVHYSGYVALPAVRAATFSELESSGRISLLQNIALRNELASFYADYRLMQDILDTPIGNYKRMLYEAIPGDIAYRWLVLNNPDHQAIGNAVARLREDARFDAAANAEVAYAADLIFWLRRKRQSAEKILSMISQSVRN